MGKRGTTKGNATKGTRTTRSTERRPDRFPFTVWNKLNDDEKRAVARMDQATRTAFMQIPNSDAARRAAFIENTAGTSGENEV